MPTLEEINDPKKPKLIFVFDTEEQKDDFAGWFSDGGGEQYYDPNFGGWANFNYPDNDHVLVEYHKDEE